MSAYRKLITWINWKVSSPKSAADTFGMNNTFSFFSFE